MKKLRKAILALTIVMAFAAAALLLPGLIGAGDLDPSGSPGPTMYTLKEIYNALANGFGGLAPVEKTGQTASYSTGDDGDLEKGVPWPNPRFTDNSDGTVTDNLTGLIWLKNANCFGNRTWSQALSDCNSLASGSCVLTDGSVAGDWRLPNLKDLLSLCHYGLRGPALPNTAGTGQWTSGDPFTNVQSSYYWSATTYLGYTDAGWYVGMNSGGLYADEKSKLFYVWPVRSGQ